VQIPQELTELLQRVSELAASAQRKIGYLIVVGLAASAYLAWRLFDAESAVWWNAIKCGAVMLPALLWCFVWTVLNQLQEAPELVAKLSDPQDGVLTNLDSLSLKKPEGLRSLFSTLRRFRQEEGFEVVFETISGITLLANPVFAATAFVCVALLMLFIIVAPLVLLL